MLNPCPRSLDAPIEVFGITYLEGVCGLAAFSLGVAYMGGWGIFLGIIIPGVMTISRRGRSRGFFLHAIQRSDLMQLPGIEPYARRSFKP